MSWVVTLALAALSFAALAFVLKAPRKGWEAIGAALLLGVAGFAWQARPAQPGAPKLAEERAPRDAGALVKARHDLAGDAGRVPNHWMVTSDAFARNGQFGDAAEFAKLAIQSEPDNSDAWLALANDLVGHAEGVLSPAARYAYRQAARTGPDQAGPPFFLGLALVTNGKPEECRELWVKALANAPRDAPWRKQMEERLARLDALIAAQAAGAELQAR